MTFLNNYSIPRTMSGLQTADSVGSSLALALAIGSALLSADFGVC